LKEPKLQFNRDELRIISKCLRDDYLETELMRVEIGLKNAEKDADSRNELQQWINLVQKVKYLRSVNKKLIKKIDKYFGE
tara:strand:- start:359 stop:598 length:240 start_codon:yes stop_codon:yes gene_type:complete